MLSIEISAVSMVSHWPSANSSAQLDVTFTDQVTLKDRANRQAGGMNADSITFRGCCSPYLCSTRAHKRQKRNVLFNTGRWIQLRGFHDFAGSLPIRCY